MAQLGMMQVRLLDRKGLLALLVLQAQLQVQLEQLVQPD
jgi:hypothetical protein